MQFLESNDQMTDSASASLADHIRNSISKQ